MNSLTLLQGSQMPALCLLSGTLGGIIGSFLGGGGRTHSPAH